MFYKKNKLSLSRSLRYSVGKGAHSKISILLLVCSVAITAGVYYFKFSSPSKTFRGVLGVSTQTLEHKYIVKSGDTLFNLAEKFNISWRDMADFNDLGPPYSITSGQELVIEQPR